jgi:hypothetical protein
MASASAGMAAQFQVRRASWQARELREAQRRHQQDQPEHTHDDAGLVRQHHGSEPRDREDEHADRRPAPPSGKSGAAEAHQHECAGGDGDPPGDLIELHVTPFA